MKSLKKDSKIKKLSLFTKKNILKQLNQKKESLISVYRTAQSTSLKKQVPIGLWETQKCKIAKKLKHLSLKPAIINLINWLKFLN